VSEPTFDTFTRRAAEALSRRSSLRTLGGAAVVAGLVAPVVAEAKKGGKGKKNKNKCKKQVSRCKEGLADICAVFFDPGEETALCVDLFAECCEFLRSCNVAQGAACIVERIPEF
jgi:hypothetical protein